MVKSQEIHRHAGYARRAWDGESTMLSPWCLRINDATMVL